MDTTKMARDVCDKWTMFEQNSPNLLDLIKQALDIAYKQGYMDGSDEGYKHGRRNK